MSAEKDRVFFSAPGVVLGQEPTPEEIKRENETLKNQIKELNDKIKNLTAELDEASELVKSHIKERDETEVREKIGLAIELSNKSCGLYRKGDLERLSVDALRSLKQVFEDESSKQFGAFLEKRKADLDSGRRKKGLSVGEYKDGEWII
jgi:predicted RNase H-like nuclease (RuvC/YqgF family)